MSKYIGKRVFYECHGCKKDFTLNKKSVDNSEITGHVFCSVECAAIELSELYADKMVDKNKEKMRWLDRKHGYEDALRSLSHDHQRFRAFRSGGFRSTKFQFITIVY